MSENFKNILLIKPSSLGDVVLALPALSALHRSFPDAKISWLIRSEFAPLLENHPYLNEVILFDRKLLGKAWFHPRALASLLSLIRRLRSSKFDAVIDLQGLFRTASLSWLSGCKKRFGMANAREFGHIFYTRKVAQDENCIHLVDFYLKIVQATGASDISVEFVFGENHKAVESVNILFKNHGIQSKKYIVFIPGSAHSDKCWPVERFAELADRISSQFALPILAVGTSSEKNTVEEIKSISNASITDFTGLTNLKELVVLLKSARLVVSNDTGPGHIAAALGAPLVMMFSWSNPARIAPYGKSECMVASEPYSRGLGIKSTDPKHSVKTITVDQVYQKVCEQMSK
ncbi:MAG: lipopolysaccharide heptosyltransferase I [Planctomycetota bacterium]|nr:MAG: lipopolysaccharide heptosyltransferase I [Planctomycetota bacterium]